MSLLIFLLQLILILLQSILILIILYLSFVLCIKLTKKENKKEDYIWKEKMKKILSFFERKLSLDDITTIVLMIWFILAILMNLINISSSLEKS